MNQLHDQYGDDDDECVFVDFGKQYAMPIPHTAICGLYGSAIFLHIIS